MVRPCGIINCFGATYRTAHNELFVEGRSGVVGYGGEVAGGKTRCAEATPRSGGVVTTPRRLERRVKAHGGELEGGLVWLRQILSRVCVLKPLLEWLDFALRVSGQVTGSHSNGILVQWWKALAVGSGGWTVSEMG